MVSFFIGIMIWAVFIMTMTANRHRDYGNDISADRGKAYIWTVNALLFCGLWDYVILVPSYRKEATKYIRRRESNANHGNHNQLIDDDNSTVNNNMIVEEGKPPPLL